MPSTDIAQLKKWFLERQRDLPWRGSSSPYAVWVSEVMLQQTQVAVVLGYFQRWMERFPTIASLAAATQDEVIKQWEGLGYYSRARNLHAGAQYVIDHFGGKLPSDIESLQKIKGLGPYTVAAIRAFAFHKRALALDGNVLRVLSRYFDCDSDIGKTATVKHIREQGESLLPSKEPWVIAEALIELGATVCKRSPQCHNCPLIEGCLARQRETQLERPVKAQRTKTEFLHRIALVIKSPSGLLLRKGQEGKIMQGLHEFPYLDKPEEMQAIESLPETLGLKGQLEYRMPQITHSFTRYRVTLDPFVFHCTQTRDVEGFFWLNWQEARNVAFSSGHRKIFKKLIEGQMNAHTTY